MLFQEQNLIIINHFHIVDFLFAMRTYLMEFLDFVRARNSLCRKTPQLPICQWGVAGNPDCN